MNLLFLINAIALGAALAMDAFSVSIANAIAEPALKQTKRILVAGTFGFFQIIMPLIGYLAVHTIAEVFTAFQRVTPWIAMALLGYIGGKMIYEAVTETAEEGDDRQALTPATLFLQGIATSIDALSVGFAIAEEPPAAAIVQACIIGIVTFAISMGGLLLGSGIMKKAGEVSSVTKKASLLGGFILIGIGLEILIRSFL